MKIKRLFAIILALSLALALTACGGDSTTANTDSSNDTETATGTDTSTDTDTDTAPAGNGITIAYITPSTTTPFWNWIEAGIKDQAEAEGYEVIVYDSNDDPMTQLANAQNAITRQVDAIIISPTDSASCPAVLEEAESAGIPVVICDVGSDEGTYLTYVSTPNYDGAYEVGKYVAQYILDNDLPLGPIGEITVPLSRINGQNRQNGFKQAMDEAGIEMTTVLESTTFTLDEAENQAQNIVTANPELVGIFAHHAQATLGTVSALDDMNLSGEVIVAAFDGDPDIVENLQNGKVLVCGAQQAKKMGREAVSALVTHFAGGDVPDEIGVPVLLLTADNVMDNIDAIDKDVCGLD